LDTREVQEISRVDYEVKDDVSEKYFDVVLD
jgi:hypothetical protein